MTISCKLAEATRYHKLINDQSNIQLSEKEIKFLVQELEWFHMSIVNIETKWFGNDIYEVGGFTVLHLGCIRWCCPVVRSWYFVGSTYGNILEGFGRFE